MELKQKKESVWNFPKRPAVQPVKKSIRIVYLNMLLVEATDCTRLLQRGLPPVYIFNPVQAEHRLLERIGEDFVRLDIGSVRNIFFRPLIGDKPFIGQTISKPYDRLRGLQGNYIFNPKFMDSITVDGEQVRWIEGSEHLGWITSEFLGPYRGALGNFDWNLDLRETSD